MDIEVPKVARNVELESCDEGVTDSEEAKPSAVESDFEYGPEFTLESFKICADDFKAQYFRENGKVLCGANLKIRTLGSGFPTSANPAKDMGKYAEYVESGWNLNNMPKLSGSLLPFGCYDISSSIIHWNVLCITILEVPQLSPSMLVSEGIPVYRCVQNPMEFVVVFPGAYHTEFSCGFNCSEAVCFAPFDWLPHGQET
ncbi:hypothetical protein OROGR_025037 [Orobanche gracilis]